MLGGYMVVFNLRTACIFLNISIPDLSELDTWRQVYKQMSSWSEIVCVMYYACVYLIPLT